MEIKDLNKRLTQVEHELILEKVKSDELCEQLRQTTAELVEQCKRVRGLERSRAELDRERSLVDTRILIEIARNEKVLHEILPADGASTVRGVDSLEQDICDKDREIRRLTSLCEAKEKEVEQGGSGCEERIDWARGELSDMRAKLEEAEDRKMRAEEKLKTLQTRVMERESQMGILNLQQCRVLFPYSQPTTGSTAQFEVHLKDARGEPCHLTRDLDVTAQLTSLVDGSTTNASLESHTQAIATLSYKATQRGRHYLTVSVNGEVITTPFPCCVQHPPAQLGSNVRTIEGLNIPYMVAITSNDHLVVAENHSISVRNLHGKLIRKIGQLEDGRQRIDFNLTGVIMGDDDVMFVADDTSGRLIKVSRNGKLLQAAGGKGKDPVQFNYPDGVTRVSNKVFVCDQYNHRVQMFDTELKFLGSFGIRGSGEGEFNYPRDIAAGRDECLYVADWGNGRVQVFSQSGSFLHSFGRRGSGPGELAGPRGIDVHNEHVYVVETDNARVSVFHLSGEFVSSFAVGQSQSLGGITTDRDGYLYVVDYTSNCVRIY